MKNLIRTFLLFLTFQIPVFAQDSSIPTIYAGQLIQEFMESSRGAGARYAGHTLAIRGLVRSQGFDVKKRRYVLLGLTDNGFMVHCTFDSSIEDIKNKELILVQGKYEFFVGGFIYFKSCELLKRESDLL